VVECIYSNFLKYYKLFLVLLPVEVLLVDIVAVEDLIVVASVVIEVVVVVVAVMMDVLETLVELVAVSLLMALEDEVELELVEAFCDRVLMKLKMKNT